MKSRMKRSASTSVEHGRKFFFAKAIHCLWNSGSLNSQRTCWSGGMCKRKPGLQRVGWFLGEGHHNPKWPWFADGYSSQRCSKETAARTGGSLEIKRRPALFVKKPSSINLTCPAMSFARIERGKQLVTEETLAHHALSTAHVLGYPFQVLTRVKSEFKFNMIQEVKSVTVKNVKTSAGRRYEIMQLLLLHSRCRSWPSTFQPPTS